MRVVEPIENDGLRWYPIKGKRKPWPSVTTALGWVFHYPGWARYDLTSAEVLFARNRGRAVHKACYWLALGRRLDMSTVDSVVEPYVFQFEDFLRETGFRTTAAEFLVWSEKFRYAGRGDLKGVFPPDLKTIHLIDIKTGSGVMAWLAGFQTSAYLRADREMVGDMRAAKRSVLWLEPDRWRLKALTDRDDFTMFLSALNCFHRANIEGAL